MLDDASLDTFRDAVWRLTGLIRVYLRSNGGVEPEPLALEPAPRSPTWPMPSTTTWPNGSARRGSGDPRRASTGSASAGGTKSSTATRSRSWNREAARGQIAAMTAWAALLRGINVGGYRRVPMAELRGLAEELGFGAVGTYVQSGNLRVHRGRRRRRRWPPSLEAALAARFGFEIPVVLRSGAEIERIATRHPFGDRQDDPAKLHVFFLAGDPDPARVAAWDPGATRPTRRSWTGGRSTSISPTAWVARSSPSTSGRRPRRATGGPCLPCARCLPGFPLAEPQPRRG